MKMDKSLIPPELQKEIIANSTDATVHKLNQIVTTRGIPEALAEAYGMAFGIAHVFKTLGLVHVHREMRKALAKYMSEK